MATHKLFLLPGDGIGPEVMGEVRKVIQWFQDKGVASFELDEGLVGGAAYDAHGESISDADMEKAIAADAIIFGAVGGSGSRSARAEPWQWPEAGRGYPGLRKL